MSDEILCVGDLHVTDKAPVSATESYTDDIIEMLYWLAQYAADRGVKAVVWAGDIFHHKSPSRNSHELVLKMLTVVRLYQALGVPLWCVTGNHDVQNGIVETVRSKQPLGVLYEAGLNELVGWHPTLPLFGVPWRETWTEPGDPAKALAGLGALDMTITEMSGDIVVSQRTESVYKSFLVVTHAPIYPPKEAENQMFELVPTMGPDGLSAAMGNQGYLYYGHIHEDHGIFEVEGVTYCNMGALSRGSLHEYNKEREIKAALWSPEAGFTEVPIPHKPASEAFRLAEVMEERGKKLSLDSFLAEVGTRTLDISTSGSVISHISARPDIEPRIKHRAISIIEGVS